MEMAILMHNGVFPSEPSLVCSPEGFLLSLSRSVIFLFLGGPETDNIKIIFLFLWALSFMVKKTIILLVLYFFAGLPY